MVEGRKRPVATHPPVADIRGLLTFRLAVLSSASDRIGQSWLHGEFGLRILEWRVIGIVAADVSIRFRDVARALVIDKGQLSRLVKALVERNLVRSETDENDQRSIRLRLTHKGARLHEAVLTRALERNERVMSALTPSEARTLLKLLDKLQPFMMHRAEELDGDGRGRGPVKNRHKRKGD